jgi:hypothetical protein
LTKRTRKKRQQRREWAAAIRPTPTVAQMLSREKHLKDHPNCTYEGPHFVPPSFGQNGFFMCDVPADLTNHTRCMAPYDHDHPDHREVRIALEEEDSEPH